jgi:hypothetical protein
MNRTIAAVTNFASAGTVRAALPIAFALSLIGSMWLAGGSEVFATLAAMQVALLAGAAAGRLAGNRRPAFAR